MVIRKFEDIVAWQKAQDFACDIYSSFKSLKDFGFRDQICRAVVSISNNIAEGFDRSSNKDFNRFLYIALGSCSETRSMIYLAKKLDYIDEDNQNSLLANLKKFQKLLEDLLSH
ncbi:MAG: four helix bundle protein [Saprospiraceae bacterium]|nr:four helix bundle protein [Saprospiraceae bacterium]